MEYFLDRHIKSVIAHEVDQQVAHIRQELEELKDFINLSIRYVTVKEAEACFKISRRTLDRYAASGKVKKYAIEGKTLFDKSELEGLIRQV